ncbi:MAG: hypothetical protein ACREI7_09860, partial [Myxococcota bacterium]
MTSINLAVLSPDSHSIAVLGRVFAEDQGLAHGVVHRLANQGPLLVVAHSTATFLDFDFLFSLAPVLGLTFIAVFALALWHGLGALRAPGRVAIVALVTAVLFTVHLLQFHFVYLHENLGSAVYLFGFVALYWLAEVEEDATPLPVAFLCLTAFCLVRVENPIGAVIFLAVTVVPGRVPRTAIATPLATFVAVVVAWNLVLAFSLPSGGIMKLNAGRCAILASLVVAFYAYWLASRASVLARTNHHVPVLAAIGCALALAGAFALEPDVMGASLSAMVENLGAFEDWGVAWYGALALGVLGLLSDRPRGGVAFVYGVALYLGVVLLLAFTHGAYTVKSNESAARMSLHVLPLAFFYLGLKLGAMTSRYVASESTTSVSLS